MSNLCWFWCYLSCSTDLKCIEKVIAVLTIYSAYKPLWNHTFSWMLVFRHIISTKTAHNTVVIIYTGVTSLARGWSYVCSVLVTRRQIILVNISHSKTMSIIYGIWWASAIMIHIFCNFPALKIRTVGLSCRLSLFIPTCSGISSLKPLFRGICHIDLMDVCFHNNFS